ncbi:MAG: MBL fold metallo-hydrolase [Deltaproteobacteria bacterium]|jgi:glyoxylase-like metal-dependent hydrolase (beta-lactamase superfamily II)|nr:MBL fold metallo-hydrolase [Deltaproteobacteria bacterium]
MPIAAFPIGPLETNAYVLHEKQDAIIVDPGGDLRSGLQHVLDFLSRHALTPQAVILTHMHFDHVMGVAQTVKSFPGIKVFGARKEDGMLRASFGSGTWGMPPVPAFEYEDLAPGDHNFGAVACTVFSTPGHSAGGLSLYVPKDNAVIVGDLLFYRSIGRTDLPGSDHQQLVKSLQQHIYSLPPATIVYAGHGPETNVGDEKQLNPFVRA